MQAATSAVLGPSSCLLSQGLPAAHDMIRQCNVSAGSRAENVQTAILRRRQRCVFCFGCIAAAAAAAAGCCYRV